MILSQRGRMYGASRLASSLVIVLTVLLAWPDAASQRGTGGINAPEHRDKPFVVLISLDGFKADYLDLYELPNLRRLAARGSRARWLEPVFPSLTFPNHYSLVTGLAPARHGIVSNRFYDPVRKQQYVYTDPAIVSDGTWYGGEPIWVTAERQGMVAACYFWPGSEAEIKNVRPSIYHPYSSDVPNEQRVETVLDWLRLPVERRPHLITLYFSELDTAQHAGPLHAPAVGQAAASLDRAIGQLVDGIDALPLGRQVYLVLTSDHGMVETTQKQSIQLASLLEPADLAAIAASFGGPVTNLHVRGSASDVRTLRDRLAARLPRGDVYLREDLPERYQYRSNPRSGNIVIVMDEGWSMSVPRATESQAPRGSTETSTATRAPRPERWGNHGWDPGVPSMRAFFMVTGPKIRQGVTVAPVRNLDVYPLLTELLDLQPAPDIDGRAGVIRSLIEDVAVPAKR